MKGSIFWITFATVSLLACGKPEEPVISPAPEETPQQAEPAPAVSSEPVEPSVEAPPSSQPEVTPAAPAKPAQPAAAKPAQTPPVAPAAKATEAAPAMQAAAKPDLAHGQQIYRQACAFCHDKGIAGAPKLGDAAAWSPRLAQGMDALYNTALRGKGAMPAKGGNPSIADADVKAAVDFIAAQAR